RRYARNIGWTLHMNSDSLKKRWDGNAPPPSAMSLPTSQNTILALGGPLCVWGCWAAMTLASFLFVWIYARDVPYFDEWTMVPVLTGDRPVTPGWLWAQLNEHRIVVSKLVQLALAKIADGDFRAGTVVTWIITVGLAAAFIVVASRLR